MSRKPRRISTRDGRIVEVIYKNKPKLIKKKETWRHISQIITLDHLCAGCLDERVD